MTKRINRFRIAMGFITLMIALVAIASFGTGYRFGNDLAQHEKTN